MKRFPALRSMALVAATTLLMAGCSNTSPAATQSPSASGTAVDIKDALLTNFSGDCADYSENYQAKVSDLGRKTNFLSVFNVSEDNTSCTVTSNDIPNYDFNDASAHFATPVAEQNMVLSIPRNPSAAGSQTELSMSSYNAVMLNGVVLDQVANGCYSPSDPSADADGNIANGCGPSVSWRLNPLGKNKLGTDSHNGHTQPGGLYHYHGNPLALFDPAGTDQGSPVIGFAADGFPIYGPHFIDPSSGKMFEAISGYTLKKGTRPTAGVSPAGSYDGTYIQDYEFTNAGTLDECNGMTINGKYGYYVTASYPYVMGCYTGMPDNSFKKTAESFPRIDASQIAISSTLGSVIIWMLVRRRNKKYTFESPTL